MIVTPEQTQGKCPEYNVPKAKCKNDSECIAGKIPRNGHGELRFIFFGIFSLGFAIQVYLTGYVNRIKPSL